MVKRLITLLLFLLFALPAHFALCASTPGDIPEDAQRLIKAYPEERLSYLTLGSQSFIVAGTKRIPFSPGPLCPQNVHPDAPQDAPLCASFSQRYPKGAGAREPEPNFDPGRVRSEALLKALFGDSADSVRDSCEQVYFFGEYLLFNSRNGAAAALRRVVARLEKLVSARPELLQYIIPSAGTYAWRTIQDSGKLSAHSFGIAVDLNVAKGPYWRWSKPTSKAVLRAKEFYPQEVVDAFEAEGFIWGGKWAAFDYMHFEYRPELLLP